MSVFDGPRAAAPTPTFDVQRAVMTIIVAAVKADGSVSAVEVMRAKSICSGTQIYAANDSEQNIAVISFALDVTDQLGDGAIDHAAAALTPLLRETAFALACDMVLADGFLSSKEERYLTGLSNRLQIADHVVSTVIDATLIRNRPA